jgi:cell division protein FtsZ
MKEELRVTVIATGVGSTPAANKQPAPREERPPMRVIPKPEKVASKEKSNDYAEFDKPTIARMRSTPVAPAEASLNENQSSLPSDTYLDIPAFLRRQAD